VYVEKPPARISEGDFWWRPEKYGQDVQVAISSASSDYTIKMIQKIHEDTLAIPILARPGMPSRAPPIRHARVPLPATLNWDLWQGPCAPQRVQGKAHPYNHWLRRYGTGEALNNERTKSTSAAGALTPSFLTPSLLREAITTSRRLGFYDTLITNFDMKARPSLGGPQPPGMNVYPVAIAFGDYGTKDRWSRPSATMSTTVRASRSTSSAPAAILRPWTPSRRYHDRRPLRQLHCGHSRPGKLNSPIPSAMYRGPMLLLRNIARSQSQTEHRSPDAHIIGDSEAMKVLGPDV